MSFVPPCALATMWSSVRFSSEPQLAQVWVSRALALPFCRGPILPTTQFALFDIEGKITDLAFNPVKAHPDAAKRWP